MGSNGKDNSADKQRYTEINGNDNRVAQRDYYELHQVHGLTVSQVNQMDVVPCPVCEQRLIRSGMTSCNHCNTKAREEAAKGRAVLMLFAAVVLLFTGYSITSAFGITDDRKHPFAIFFAGLVCASLVGLFFTVRRWLRDPSQSEDALEKRKLILAVTTGLIGICGVFLGQFLPDGFRGWSVVGGSFLLLFTMSLLR